jgi:hypothetical protein
LNRTKAFRWSVASPTSQDAAKPIRRLDRRVGRMLSPGSGRW